MLVKLLEFFIFCGLLFFQPFLLFLLRLLDLLVFGDVLMQVLLVILEFLARVDQRLVAALLSILELPDLLFNYIVGKLR